MLFEFTVVTCFMSLMYLYVYLTAKKKMLFKQRSARNLRSSHFLQVFMKKLFKKFQTIHMKTLVSESLFEKAVGP